MATQQLMFDILATARGVDDTFNEVTESAETMSGRLSTIGAQATEKLFNPLTAAAAGGVAGAALMTGLTTAIERDSAVNALTNQLDLTGPQAATAGAAAGSLYNQGFGESFESVTAAVGDVMSSISGMSSASQAEVETLTGQVIALADTFGIDTARAAQIAGQMITTGLAKDGIEAADLLTVALQKVPTAVREDILDAMDEYGPFFSQLGIGGESALQLLVNASEKGMFGIDKLGDALKEFTIRSTDMSKATGEAYAAIGLDQTEMTNDLLQGGAKGEVAFAKIKLGLADIKDPAAQSQAALALFGTPLEDLSVNEIPKFIQALSDVGSEGFGNVEGSAAAMADSMNTGPAAALDQFRRLVESSLSDLGAQVLPMLTPVLEGLSQFAPIIGPAVIALGALAVVIGVVNAVMAVSPITWIIVGIVALIAAIVLLVMNWDTVVAFITQVWGGFVGWMQGVLGGFVGWWNGVWAGFFGWTSGLWSGFTGWLSALWAGLVALIAGIVVGHILWLNGAFTGAVDFATSIWGGLTGFFSGLWSGIVDGVSNTIGNIGDFFSGLPATIMGFFGTAGTWLYTAGQDIVNGLGSGLQSMAGSVGNFFLDLLPGWIVGPFKAALGIASPSKVFAGFGQNIGEGVLVGVGRMQTRIDDRMANLVTVPDSTDMAFGVGASGGSGFGSGASKMDELLTLLKTQRPIQVAAAPGMSETMIGRSAAEQLMWRGK
ncbi:phage tail tape measure protein [Arthrobacter sp. HLT1-20]